MYLELLVLVVALPSAAATVDNACVATDSTGFELFKRVLQLLQGNSSTIQGRELTKLQRQAVTKARACYQPYCEAILLSLESGESIESCFLIGSASKEEL